MIKLDYSQILDKIHEKTKLANTEIEEKVKTKMEQLSGLISKEGAAHIVANELNVELFDDLGGKIKVEKIAAGIRNLELVGKVTNVFEIREFARKDGGTGKVGSFILADETGSIRVTLWNDLTEKMSSLKQDDIVKIQDAYSKENQGRVEVQLSGSSKLNINPEGESVGEVKTRQDNTRKKINELGEADTNIEILGTIMQVFDPRFYEVCPECNKRVKNKEGKFTCEAHNEIIPKFNYVMNAVLDDGSGSIRTVFFKNQMINLLAMTDDAILKIKDNPNEFTQLKNDLMGKVIKVIGRVNKNEMFERLEFVSQVVLKADPDTELKKLEKEAKVID